MPEKMTLAQLTDPERCARRNLAAALQGRSAAPFQLYAGSAPEPPEGARIVTAKGKLITDPQFATDEVNRRAGLSGADAYKPEQLLFVYPEAANQNYVVKYNFFLGLSTLRNIYNAAEDGIAFMNSHRTGGSSTKTELPFGTTFCGRMETLTLADGARSSRVLMGAFMVSGLRPNGSEGPSTDDFYESIKSRSIGNVSLGFSTRGDEICDVCGQDNDACDTEGNYLCSHIPGTHRKMTEEEIATQLARGVPKGVATVTLENATVSELSAVYSGALPGAGFRKAARMSRLDSGPDRLEGVSLTEARSSYAYLLSADPDCFGPRPPRNLSDPVPDLKPKPVPDTKGDQMATPTLADVFAFWDATGRPKMDMNDLKSLVGSTTTTPVDPPKPTATVPVAAAKPPTPSEPKKDDPHALQLAAMQAQFDQQAADHAAQRKTDREAANKLHADTWAKEQIQLGRLTPAERPGIINQYLTAADDDDVNPRDTIYLDPSDNTTKTGTRLSSLKASVERRPKSHTTQRVVAGAPAQQSLSVLSPDGDGEDGEQVMLKAIDVQVAKWAKNSAPSSNGAAH